MVGINRYEDSQNITPLQYAERDAWRVGNLLEEWCGFEKVVSLPGANAGAREINDATDELCRGLGQEDLFLFYFAGHGYEEAARGHLLLASDVRLKELRTGRSPDVIPVEGLEAATAECGADRVLLIDACREKLERGRGGHPALGVEAARDIEATANEVGGSGPLAVICSCGPEERAHEIPDLRAGAFTQALVNVLKERAGGDQPVAFPRELDIVNEETSRLLEENDIAGSQMPWHGGSCEEVV